MIKKIGALLVGMIVLITASPMFLYWWGLANLVSDPVPSQLKLTAAQEKEIWIKEKETGVPKLKKITPYGYILYFSCNASKGLNSAECMSKCPGLRVSAFAVRRQVAEQVYGKGNMVWQLTWAAYSIWVTRNWDIHQILATYHETYNT